MKIQFIIIFVLSTIVCSSLKAQKIPDGQSGATMERAPVAQENNRYAEMLNYDFANLNRYRNENMSLGDPAPGEQRVVFMGNSITEFWKRTDSDFFEKHKSYICRGIGGQTTPQMLVRFRSDVINLHPAAVVILAGTNDIAGNTGPARLEDIFGNIVSMAELAGANNIKVFLCSVLPASDYPWSRGLEPAEKIVRLNKMLFSYSQEKDNVFYVDYHTPMADSVNAMNKAYSNDGVHPSLNGYKVMERIIVDAVSEVLKGKR